MIKFVDEMTNWELMQTVIVILGLPAGTSRDHIFQECHKFCENKNLRLYIKTVSLHTGGTGDRPRVTYMSKVGKVGEIVPNSDPNQVFSDNWDTSAFKAIIKYFLPGGVDLPD